MSKESLAKNYAKEAANNFIEKALETAYLIGFEAGVESVKIPPMIVIEDGVEYVDLGLPSGTLWSSELHFVDESQMVSYPEAQKYNIPNRNQLMEFIDNTQMMPGKTNDNIGWPCIDFIGPNGNKVKYIKTGYHERKDRRNVYFWFSNDELPKNNQALSCNAYYDKTGCKRQYYMFTGYHLPLALVKTRK